MVTGQLPFTAESNYAMMAAHLQEVPKPPIVLRPGIPQTLNQIIVMALAKDPGQRFQSADAFRGALKSVPAQGAATQAGADPRAFVPSASAGSATALFHETPASQSPTTVMDTPALPTNATRWAVANPAAAAADAMPQAPPPAVRGNSHRGLYIALGAFIVVAVLFAAGLYLPSRIKTLAGAGKSTPPSQQASSSATNPSPTTPPASGDAMTPSTPTPASTDPNAPTSAGAPTAAASAQAVQSGQSSPDSSNASSTTSTDVVPASSAASNSGGASAQPAKKPSPANPKKIARPHKRTPRLKPTKPQPSRITSTATTTSTAAPPPSRNPWTIFSASKLPLVTAFAATSFPHNSA